MGKKDDWKDLGNGYETKSWTNKQGNQGTIYRPKGQKGDYPHDTEFRDKNGNVIDEHKSSSRDEHNRRVTRNRSFWFQADPDFGSDDKSSSSGGCYIATASLQGNLNYEDLLPLKDWRYNVLEGSAFGHRLSNYYRRTAPSTALKVERRHKLSLVLRSVFVKPALMLVERRLARQPQL